MKEKRDVLFLCQFFYPEYVSSATLPYDTAQALNKAGFTVDALCGYPREYNLHGPVPKQENVDGIGIQRLKYIQTKRAKFVGRLINYFSFTFAVLLQFARLRNYRSIIVYSNPPVLPWIASMAAKMFGTKVIFVCYDVYPEIAIRTNTLRGKSIICKMMRAINKSLYKRVSMVVALSQDMKDFLLQNRKELDERRITVIPNWYEDKQPLDHERAFTNPLFEKLTARKAFVVSYFGNMGVAQDLDTLLSVIKEFRDSPDIAFLFAGHGKKVASINEMSKTEQIDNVYVFDFLHDTDYPDALCISDAFVVTLGAELTGMAVPSKTYSYMMSGKPVIAIMSRDTDLSKELTTRNAGFGLNVGDISGLVSALKKLRSDDAGRQAMGANARKLFKEKYTTEICTARYTDVVRKFLNGT